jgi:hypothetical protein
MKEESYFRGMKGPASTTLVEPDANQAGVQNKGGLLTINSQLMRVKKGTAPSPQTNATFYVASWSHPANTSTGTVLTSTGTVTAAGAPSGSTGRWVWLIRNVTDWESDMQFTEFTFATGLSNSTAVFNNFFETHNHDAGFDDVDTDTEAKIVTAYQAKINLADSFPFRALLTATTNSVWNSRAANNGTPSGGTGIILPVSYVYYEASGTFTGGNNSFLRTDEITYTGAPSCSFDYVLYSTVPADAGAVLLYWVVES